jgi:hypothetical protein
MALSTIRNIKPRVYSAVHNLGTFTISELCAEARLTDRAQAYSQIRGLKERGFLDERTLPATGSHAPLKEYRLVSDSARRSEFAEVVASYSRSFSKSNVASESELAEAALADAIAGLAKLERSLSGLEAERGSLVSEKLSRLEPEFEAAWTNIQTAQLEYSDSNYEQNPSSSLSQAISRWELADTRRRELRKSEQKRATGEEWSLLLAAAANFVGRILAGEPPLANNDCWMSLLESHLSKELNNVHRAPLEMLLDEIRSGNKYLFTPVFRHALRTGDSKLVFKIADALKDVKLSWWQYNFENTRYLKTSRLRQGSWLAAYQDLLTQVSSGQLQRTCSVYSFDLQHLTEEIYLRMTIDRGVSLVSPLEITYLGASEVVRPTMLMRHGNVLESLACAFLKPDDCLYAYGPIANDISRWQGASEIRVAACLGMWGLPLDEKLSGVMEPLKKGKAILALEGKKAKLDTDLARLVGAEEIGECIAA